MTLGEGFEIPPFDNAADITRSTRTQPGEVLADSRNWAGFALLFAAGISVVIAVTAFTAGRQTPGTVAAVLAGVAMLGGLGLIVVEFRRRTAARTALDAPIRWRSYEPSQD
ncbi:hypothetical protein [Nocardia sp. NBC_00511]|uniref:hypothetical protein n=1 Tax=Nocardia sp. NBC_00511 TaxID=2903591 RepID=UPI0030E09A4D